MNLGYKLLSLLAVLVMGNAAQHKYQCKPTGLETRYSGCTELESKVLFASKRDGENAWTISMMNPNGQNLEVLVAPHSGQGEYNPDILANGEKILFNTYRYGGWKLASFNIKTKKVHRITKGSHYYVNGVFSNDGKRIAYERNVERSTQIFVSDVSGSNEVLISKGLGKENRAPFWDIADNAILFYNENGSSNDIYRVNLNTLKKVNVTNNSSGNDFNPSVSLCKDLVKFT